MKNKIDLNKLVKVETFNTRNGKKRYIVARKPNGTIDQKIPFAGSQSEGNIKHFRGLYKQQNSLHKDQQRTIISGRQGTVQHSNFIPSSLANRDAKPIRKPRGMASYFVSGEVVTKRGKRITVAGTSLKKGSVAGLINTSREAKEMAWEVFLRNLAATLRGNEHYDEDEGIKLVEQGRVENIREGWVRYQ